MKYALQLSYKGTAFHGWQKQKNAKTVQEELNKGLGKVLGHKIESLGSGRTDTGVHAREQFAMFETEKELNSFKYLNSINAVLSYDISVYGLYKISEDANVRFDALSRTYEYRICKRKDPFEKEFSAFLPLELDVDAMNKGAEFLLSQKDFKSFAKSGSDQHTSICKLMEAKWEREGHILTFTIKADRFLRNMVRAITGTLIELGEGKIGLSDLETIVLNQRRSDAGKSMPACGLFLKNVEYPIGYFQKI